MWNFITNIILQQQQQQENYGVLAMICIWDSISCIGYIVMTMMIYASYFIPSLNDLASHGKTRMNTNHSDNDNHNINNNNNYDTTTNKKNKNSNREVTTNLPNATNRTSSSSSILISTITTTISSYLLHTSFHLNHPIFLVQKKYFRQFYIIGIIYLTYILYVYTIMMNMKMNEKQESLLRSTDTYHISRTGGIILTLLYIHLFRRLYECTYVHVWKDTSVMHVAGYLVGLIHYIWLPHVFVRLPCSTCCYRNTNDKNDQPFVLRMVHYIPQWLDEQSLQQQRQHLSSSSNSSSTSTTTNHFATIQFIAAIVLCLYGQYQQYRHHVLLANIRRKQSPKSNSNTSSSQSSSAMIKEPAVVRSSSSTHDGITNITTPGDSKKDNDTTTTSTTTTTKNYTLPTGGWFQYVTCPHYLAEIIIYLSFAVLLEYQKMNTATDQYSYYGYRHILVVLWVTSNLIMSAWINHGWYLKHLPLSDQVHTKHAIVPFLL